jgi:predicted RNA binding protein YcfA (HicA-like mRNA interferase family)
VKAVTGKEMCRAPARRGWSLDHIHGSHHIFTKPGHRPISVPVHAGKTLKPRTQRSIMRATGLTDDDL